MRNFAIVAGALVVLALGFVLATRSDEADAPTTSAQGTTTETVTTPPTATTVSTETATTPAPAAAPEPTVPTVTVTGGKPEGGVQKLAFTKGERVRFKVDSDVADEIHVHGFDLMKDVEAGGSVSFAFAAEFDGKYEVELEDAGVQIASLEIQP